MRLVNPGYIMVVMWLLGGIFAMAIGAYIMAVIFFAIALVRIPIANKYKR